MKTMSKILTVIALVVLCVSLFTLTAFAEHDSYECDPLTLEHHEKVKATCAEEGTEEYWRCPVCGRCYSSASPSESTWLGALVKIPVDPTAHPTKPLPNHTTANDPTCVDDGNVEYYTCDTCGKNFEDQDGTKELTDTKVPKTGVHDYANGTHVNPKDAKCNEDGNVEYWICPDCDCYCDSSGAKLNSVTISKDTVGHTWGEWKVTKEPTATSGGTRERKCTVCNTKETETIPPTQLSSEPSGNDLYYLVASRDTYYRGEELPSFWSDLIEKLNKESGPNKNYVGVRIGTDKSLYANSFHTFDFWSSGNKITLGQKLVDSLDEGTYYIWVYNVNDENEHTDSIPWYIVDTPTLDPINTDKHVVNSTKNLRFRASEPIKDASVKVGGKALLDDNYYYVSNDGLTITLSPDFLNERQVGTYTISANTVSDNTKVSTHFYILSTASASASPKTGDESQLGLWAAFLLLSGAAVVVLVPKIRKHGA